MRKLSKQELYDQKEMQSEIRNELYGVDADGHSCEQKCVGCCDIERCHTEARIRSMDTYAEALDYGGYDSAEDFWEQVYQI